jgi:hypothetical protein
MQVARPDRDLQRAFSGQSVRFTATDLGPCCRGSRYLVADAIRGWMFTASVASRPLPYVVTRLDYTPPSNDETGRVFIELKANAKGAITSTTLRIAATDIVGKTVPEIFAAKGFLKETPELIRAYDDTEGRYFAWRARYGRQFSGTGTGLHGPELIARDTDWSRKDVVVLSSGGGSGRLVSDEAILSTQALTLGCGIWPITKGKEQSL